MTARYIGAIVAIIIGVILVLSNYGLLPQNFDILKLWPLLLIIWGVWIIVALSKKKK
jgi:LiaI-LiaF-like transmembrane region